MSETRFEDFDSPGSMTAERFAALSRGEGCLALEEWREGWHYCHEMGLDLLQDRGTCRWCGFDPKLMPLPESGRMP